MWTANPLVCGTLMLDLTLFKKQAGIPFPNHYLSIHRASYLYTSTKQQYLVANRWLLLERLVVVHMSSIFFGSASILLVKKEIVFKTRLGLNAAEVGTNNGRV